MTKRFVAVCLVVGALVASSSAFASRARQLVLGTADPLAVIPHGTFMYDDNLNVLYNPAYAADFKNWVAIEKTNGMAGGATTNRAEGGFVTGFGSFAIGAYFNRADAFLTQSGFTSSYTNVANMRPIDIVFAGDSGSLKYGLGLTYGFYRAGYVATGTKGADGENDTQDLTVRAGVSVADFEPFADFKIIGKQRTRSVASATTIEDKVKGYAVGMRYHWGEWVPFLAYRHFQTDGALVTGTGNSSSFGGSTAASKKTKYDAFGGGFARSTKLAEGTQLNYALAGWRQTRVSSFIVPVDVSIEHDLNSWMLIRGGMQYRFWDRSGGVSNADSTTGRIGAGFKFGKATVDWAFGSTANSSSVSNAAGSAADGSTIDFANGIFNTASLTYNW